MALTGNTNAEKIWNFFKGKGLNEYGISGLLGNLEAESGLRSDNLQNTFEKKLGYTDETYTKAVNEGTYTGFIADGAGYGLAQWTFWSRKKNLLEYAKSKKVSIGDLEMQLEFLYEELQKNYRNVLEILKSADSIRQASNTVLLNYERPADQSTAVQEKRAANGQKYYEKYANVSKNVYSNSPLASLRMISPHKNSPRNHVIDTVSIHCYVGQVTAKAAGQRFSNPNAKCSCNYMIDKDGIIMLIVEEKDRSWCTSSVSNDNRAITIECACDRTAPYVINDKVYASLINLLTDICKRNNIKELKWQGDKKLIGQVEKQNMTVHRWFANKECPGDYLYNRHGQIAEEVNRRLGIAVQGQKKFPETPFGVQVLIDDLNYRAEPSMGGKIKGQTGKGRFTIVEVNGEWGKLKSGVGWILLCNPEYCEIKTNGFQKGTGNTFEPYEVRIDTAVLNVRSGPGTNYGITKKVKKGEVYTIVEETTNGEYTWGKLKSEAGYISLAYTKKN